MIIREIAGLLVLVVGAVLAVAGFVAAGWWSLVILGGSAMVVGGLAAVTHRTPESDDEDVTSPDWGD